MENGLDITEINHFSSFDDDTSEDGANSDIFYGYVEREFGPDTSRLKVMLSK